MAATPLEKYRFGDIEETPLNERIGKPEFRLKPDFDLTSLPPAKDLSEYDSPVQGKDPQEDTGANSLSCMHALEKYGNAHEADWPYEVSKVSDKPPPEAYNRGSVNQALNAGYLQASLNSIRAAVASECAVYISFIAFEGFRGKDTTATGIISIPSRDSPAADFLGPHAMIVIGYDDDSRLFKCKNSWGSERGQAGYYFLPFDYLDAEWRYNPNEDPLKLMHDECWTVDAIEYESDDVILHDRPGIRNLTPFEVSAVGA
ncbi:hypothetical protein N7475_006798 [Penicillium sp. IBT 31633x]|nr:hypothetical protein N7475_006798 [Penicillium sp. IBT 31633x]